MKLSNNEPSKIESVLKQKVLSNLTEDNKRLIVELLRKKEAVAQEQKLEKFVPNPGAQENFLKSQAKIRAMFTGQALGKCFKAGTEFLMYDGTVKKVEEIQVGDVLIGPDSTPKTVTSLASGSEEMYAVYEKGWDKKHIFTCNKSHILVLKYISKEKHYSDVDYGDIVKVTVEEYLKWPESRKKRFVFTRSSLDWKESPVTLDPYLFGTWLGDGHSASARITTMNTEIVNYWEQFGNLRAVAQSGKAQTYTLANNDIKFLNKIQQLKCFKNKHIPAEYLANSRKVRLELLAGLLDTDGYFGGSFYEITQKNKQLALDIQRLARSLGYRASLRVSYKYASNTTSKIKRLYYRINISGPHLDEIPLKLSYKKCTRQCKPNRNPEHYSIEIVSEGVGQYLGFTVDNPDGTVMLADLTVTHNTTALVIDLMWHHLGIHPYRPCDNISHTWLIVPSHEKAEDYWNTLKQWCPPSQLPSVDKMGSSHIRRFRWRNGSLTTIFSHEQDFSKLEGTNISALYMDEAPPRALWISAFRGLRSNPDYFAVITTTPYAEPWLFQEIYQPWIRGEAPHIEVFRGSTFENKHISKEWIDDYSRMMSEEERAVRIHGGFAAVSGRVFGEFDRETHLLTTQEWPADWPVWCCIDPHVRKAHTAVWLGITPEGNHVVLDEVYVKGTIADLATQIKEVNKKYPGLEATYIDTKGVEADWTRSSAVDILFQNGVKCTSVKKTDKDIMSGISRIKQLLRGDIETGEPFLKIMEHCRNTITEFEMYSWAENRHPERTGTSERPRKTHDDFIDPLRYLIAKNLGGSIYYNNENDEPVSLFQSTSYVKKDNKQSY